MHSSDNSKTSAVRALIFICVLLAAVAFLNFLLCPLSSMNIKFIRYHAYQKNIDCLVLGNSLEGDGINAQLASEILHNNTYVFAPQGSYPESLYYILLDVAAKHKLKTIVIGWDIIQNFQTPPYQYPHAEELWQELIPDARQNKPLAKILFSKVMEQRYTSTFFKYSSFPENILELQEVQNSKKKNPLELDTGTPPAINISTLETDTSFHYTDVVERKFDPVIQENDISFICKIRDFCALRGIQFLVVSNPIPECIMAAKPELSQCLAVSAVTMRANRIPYINASDQQLFPGSMTDTNFKDCYGHIIEPYRSIYTKHMCELIAGMTPAETNSTAVVPQQSFINK